MQQEEGEVVIATGERGKGTEGTGLSGPPSKYDDDRAAVALEQLVARGDVGIAGVLNQVAEGLHVPIPAAGSRDRFELLGIADLAELVLEHDGRADCDRRGSGGVVYGDGGDGEGGGGDEGGEGDGRNDGQEQDKETWHQHCCWVDRWAGEQMCRRHRAPLYIFLDF